MTTQYAGIDLWADEISHTTDDDVRDASSVSISAIGLADRTRYLKNRGFYSTPAFGTDPYTNSGTYRIAGQIIFTAPGGISLKYATVRGFSRTANLHAWLNPSYWEYAFNDAPPKGHYRQSVLEANASNSGLVFDFDIPSNCIVTRVAVRVDPVTHVALPDVKPTIFVYLVDVVAGTTTLIGTAIDPSLTLAAYNAIHVIDLSFIMPFDASRNRIMVKVFGEADDVNTGLAISGLKVHLPTVEFWREQIADEFGEILP